MKKRLKIGCTLLVGTLLLSIIGLYNGYPLVYSDTGTYIRSGIEMIIPMDRPITYGLFIHFFSLGFSLWFVIIVQNFLTAYVLFEFMKLFDIKESSFSQFYLSVILFLVIFTGIGWYSNQLMPDFFTPIAALTIFIILINKKITIPSLITLGIILVYSLITHFSHLMIGTILIIVILIIKLIMKERLMEISFRKILLTGTIILSGWLILPTINYLTDKEFAISKGSHVFLMAHLADTGILEKFLKENCNNEEYSDCKLCQYKDNLPKDLSEFIWVSNILENTGGWAGSKKEYNKIIRGTLTQPKYLLMNIYRSITYGFIQLTQNEIGQGLSAYNEGSAPHHNINIYYYNEMNNYLNSRQNKLDGIHLKHDKLNSVHLFLLILSLFVVIIILTSSFWKKIYSVSIIFLFFALTVIVINSFITAGLNSPCSRFEGRIVWLLPLAVILILVKNRDILFDYFFKKDGINSLIKRNDSQ